MKKTLLALASVFALVLVAAPVRADDPAPGIGPVAIAEIASFSQLQQDVTALGTAVGQPMLSMGLLGAGQLVASPGMLGIDRDKPIRVALLGEPDALANALPQLKAVIALPLSDADGAAYFQSVLTSGSKKSSADGYHVFNLSNSPLGNSLQAVVANGYAFLSTDDDIPEAELRAIAARGPDALAVPGLRGTIRIAAPASTLAAPLRKGVRTLLEEAFADLTAVPTDDDDVVAVRNDILYLVDLFAQNDTLSLGLDFTAGRGLSLWSRADALAGSDAAAIAASLRTPEDSVLSVFGEETDAFGLAVGADPALLQRLFGGFTRFIKLAAKLATAAAGDADASQAKVLELIPVVTGILEKSMDMIPFLSGSFAETGTFDADGGMAYRIAMGCTDADGFRAANKALRENLLGNEAIDFMGYENLDPREANGLVIDRSKFSYDIDKLLARMGVDASAAPPPAAAQMDMLRAMYAKLGENTMESTVRDGTAFFAWAPGEAPLDALLARTGKSATLPANLFADLPELSTCVFREYFDYAKFLPSLLKQLPPEAVDPDDAEFKTVMDKILSTPDFLAAVTWRDGDSLLSALRIDENVFRDVAAWGEYMTARFRRQWEERARQQQQQQNDDDDDDFDDDGGDDDPLSGLSEEDRKKIGIILDNNGDFDDNK